LERTKFSFWIISRWIRYLKYHFVSLNVSWLSQRQRKLENSPRRLLINETYREFANWLWNLLKRQWNCVGKVFNQSELHPPKIRRTLKLIKRCLFWGDFWHFPSGYTRASLEATFFSVWKRKVCSIWLKAQNLLFLII